MAVHSQIFTRDPARTGERPSAGLGRRLAFAIALLVALQVFALGWSLFRPMPFVGFQLFALACMAILLWRALLFARYRPVPAAPDAQLPALTVVVPAYNEGAQVLSTVRSLVASDYPRAKLEILCIDDGSADDTWAWIQAAARAYPDQVVALHCPQNRGKREALYEGFGRAHGDVIVTVDSDSEVLPDALRKLVSPIAVDPRVGAVAGNVRVLNPDGAIPEMMDVLFTNTFEFVRVTQSETGAVLCCPGALSAYRRDLVMQFKDRWSQETFLGVPSTIGEDRAMTNHVLRLGYQVKFQSDAVVLTTVPVRTRQLSKMFLRWARSDVRESLVLAKILAARGHDWQLGVYVNLLTSSLALLLSPLALGCLVASVAGMPWLFGWALAGTLIGQLLPALVFGTLRGWRRAWWAFPYGVYYLLCLSWIQPYGLITPHRASWLTRQLPAARVPRLATATADFADEQRAA